MPRRFWNTRSVRLLDKRAILDSLKRLARRAQARNPQVRQIVLFGSLAQDAYTARSDADLLIVLRKDTRSLVERIPEWLMAFADAPVPVDVFPYTEEEVTRHPWARRALAQGVVLVERGTLSGPRAKASTSRRPIRRCRRQASGRREGRNQRAATCGRRGP